jgi:ubiquinone/menaquinone biosynthesis C-methylase UbiE
MAQSIPGFLLIGQLWWYGLAVLRPAQLLKAAGLLPRNDLGQPPRPMARKGGGRRYSLRRPYTPTLLPDRPAGYESVEEFDSVSDMYANLSEPFTRPVFEETVRIMTPLIGSAARILDTSCGPGLQVCQLAELVPDGEVVGSDLSAAMVTRAAENARGRGLRNVAFFQADVGALPAHFKARFDVVFCSFAFHHYPDGKAAAREMRRVLRPGGKAFIIDAGPAWMKALASPISKLGDPGWVAFRTGEEFAELCREAGFGGFYWTEVLPGIGLSIATR